MRLDNTKIIFILGGLSIFFMITTVLVGLQADNALVSAVEVNNECYYVQQGLIEHAREKGVDISDYFVTKDFNSLNIDDLNIGIP